jgi:hypothetical protein
MTNTGLIVFLPLVGAVVGAVFGAFANGLYRDWQDKKARDREREGLVRLIAAEVATNNAAFTTLTKAANIELDLRTAVRTTVWDESKVSLAQLMPANYIAQLTEYYTVISVALHDLASSGGQLSFNDMRRVSNLRRLGDHVLSNAEENINDPGFVKWLRIISSGKSFTDEDAP